MYNYDYEFEVLATLRVLKLLHSKRPEVLPGVLSFWDAMDMDTVEEIACNAVWELFDQWECAIDEETELEVITVTDALFLRYLELSRRWYTVHVGGCGGAHVQKFQDLACFALQSLGSSIYDITFQHGPDSMVLRLWLSPDCYEPSTLAHSVVDFLLTLEMEIDQMDELLKEPLQKEAA